MDGAAERRLKQFFDLIGGALGNPKRKASFAIYATGLLSSAERKSMEPIAALASADETTVDAMHQRLGHFVTDSNWSDREVRRIAAEHALAAMFAHEPVEHWIIDDTGFLKQGQHSVGVQRQYTGSAGKIANSQIGVSLSVSSATEHVPIDFELYLPESWTEDAARRKEARIPEGLQFKTKPELALEMIDRALEDGVPPGVVLADEAYGTSIEFRDALRERGLDYAVGINGSSTFWPVDRNGKVTGLVSWSAKEMAEVLAPKSFRRTTWREGTGGRLSARFAARRVLPAHRHGPRRADREVQWLLMEWRDGEPHPAHFYLLTLPPETTRKELVRVVKERWRTERVYEDLKGELGLDHFEGRRFSGWHHHVSVALACYAFITAERAGAFFPSEEHEGEAGAHQDQAREALPEVLHHGEAVGCSCGHDVAPSMSDLPSGAWAADGVTQPSRVGVTQ